MISRKIPKAIIFFGPDGSGKTTQADLLVKILNEKGVRTQRMWLRSLHTLAYAISIVTMHMMKSKDIYELRTKFYSNQFSGGIWSFIEFVSIIPLILSRFYLPLAQDHVVVAERFVIDWVVSIAYAKCDASFIDSIFSKI